MTMALSWASPALTLVLSPLLLGVINRVKAVMAGRVGQPLLQPYRDLARLLGKGAVVSETASWVLPLSAAAGLAAVLVAALLMPLGAVAAPLAFAGDFVALVALLGLNRASLVLGALDTGSSFGGMGASREVLMAPLAETALLVALTAVARLTGETSLSAMLARLLAIPPLPIAPILVLVALALFIVFLAENARLPVDDPNTHLELTMIHEVMVLDHSGPDLAFVHFASALKLWVLGSLVVGLVLPFTGVSGPASVAVAVLALLGLAAGVGFLESTLARLRLRHVPHLLMGAVVAAVLSLVLVFR